MTTDTFGESGEAELPGLPATEEQIQMLETRYRYAASLAPETHGAVLEIGAGAGQGIACLEAAYDHVVVGDIRDENLLLLEQAKTSASTEILRFSSESLPFEDAMFDTVLILEAIYYFEQPKEAIAEAHRVLKPEGKLFLTVPNPNCVSFVPSTHAFNYFGENELQRLLTPLFHDEEVIAAFPYSSVRDAPRVLKLRRVVASLFRNLRIGGAIRRVMRKKLLGYSMTFPSVVQPAVVNESHFVAVPNGEKNRSHKVLYFVAKK